MRSKIQRRATGAPALLPFPAAPLLACTFVLCGITYVQGQQCPQGKATTVSGKVYAPNGTDPLPGVLVYIPGAPITPFTPGVSCEPQISGAPLASGVSATDGSFTLEGVPEGADVPLVIQTGRWRRQVTIPKVAACTNTALPSTLTHLPSSKAEGDIPRIAIVTGSADGLECVLRKMGIADTEFTDAGGRGRINLFKGSGSPGAVVDAQTSAEEKLEGAKAELNAYDMVMFACQGGQYLPQSAYQTNLIDYANAGGRVFATHFGYVWLYDDAPFSETADWDVNQQAEFTADPETANVVETITNEGAVYPTGVELAQWLKDVGASTTLGQLPLGTLRKDQDGVTTGSQAWLQITDDRYTTPTVMQFSFNTPVNQPEAKTCGRVMFSEYHTEDQTLTAQTLFPAECSKGPMTAQEKLLEFSLFNLTADVTAMEQPQLAVGVASQTAKLHQGDSADAVTINVTNSGTTLAATPSLLAIVALPPGVTAKSLKGADVGTGWICDGSKLRCTRNNALKPGAADPIAVVASVESNAPVSAGSAITATVAGGGLLSAVTATKEVTITGRPIIAWPGPKAIVYGTSLSARQLNASTTVPGKFTYAPANGKVLAAGAQTLTVTFTPTDTIDFESATAKVTLQVNRAELTFAAKSESVAYEKPIPKLAYTVTGFVNHDTSAVLTGDPSETTAAKEGSKPGTYPIDIAKGTLKASNYAFVFKDGELTITPVPTAVEINRGR